MEKLFLIKFFPSIEWKSVNDKMWVGGDMKVMEYILSQVNSFQQPQAGTIWEGRVHSTGVQWEFHPPPQFVFYYLPQKNREKKSQRIMSRFKAEKDFPPGTGVSSKLRTFFLRSENIFLWWWEKILKTPTTTRVGKISQAFSLFIKYFMQSTELFPHGFFTMIQRTSWKFVWHAWKWRVKIFSWKFSCEKIFTRITSLLFQSVFRGLSFSYLYHSHSTLHNTFLHRHFPTHHFVNDLLEKHAETLLVWWYLIAHSWHSKNWIEDDGSKGLL